jgi:exopolysaccharide production protein ExoQ
MELNLTAGSRLKSARSVNHSSNRGGTRSKVSWLGTIPLVAFSYVLIFLYLLGNFALDTSSVSSSSDTSPNVVNRLFFPLLFLSTLVLVFVHRSRIRWDFFRIPAVASLIAYLILAGASITWAYSPEYSFNRYLFQLMLVTSVLLPYALNVSHADTLRSMFICYVIAIVINVLFVLNESPRLNPNGTVFGYQGYFTFKGYLGECASAAILTSFYALKLGGWRRFLAVCVIAMSIWLVFLSESKGSLAFAIVSPILAAGVVMTCKRLNISMMVIVAIVVGLYLVSLLIFGNLMTKLAYDFYGDSTLTGRTIIWDFVQGQMWQHQWFGWGFHSFWLVGPNAPSVTQAPFDWVSHMTGSHSGYIDVKLETGNVGYSLFLCFLFGSLQIIGRVIKVDPFRAWLLLSLALFVIITNLLETVWLNNDQLWVVFLLIVGDATRYRNLASQVASTREKQNPVRGANAGISPANIGRQPGA